MSDHRSTRRAPAPSSPLPWLIALAGPVVVSLALVPLRGGIRTSNVNSFTIASRDDVETAVLLVVVGLVVGELVVRARRSEERAAESRAEVVHVRRLSELAAGGESRGRLIGIVQGELVSLLPVRECKFEHGASAHDLPEITHKGVLARHGARQPVPVMSS